MKAHISFGLTLIFLISGASGQRDVKPTELQQRVCRGLWNAVNEHYVYADFRGNDWKAIGAKYQARIQGGMNNDEFYATMQAMLGELGDEHSYFQSPSQIKAEQAARASQYNFVGIRTRIGYIFLPTLLDETVADQTREALKNLTTDGPLDGLVLDNRMNGGGLGKVAESIMGLFAAGLQGYFVSRSGREPLQLKPEDIGGSQTVPLIVLVDVDTVSFGEIVSGVLRLSGRARIVGGPTLGNVERLRSYNFDDGSRAWIASETFEPRGQTNGIWEETGIIPDVEILTRWHQITEDNDPALAKAVELLTAQKSRPPFTVF